MNDITANESEENEFDDDIKSKSQRKREAKEITNLGKYLLKLSISELERLNIPQYINDEMNKIKKINSKTSAYKRETLHLGKILRNYEGLEMLFSSVANKDQEIKHKQILLTEYHLELLNNKNETVEKVLSKYPDINRQKLRQLIRNIKPGTEDMNDKHVKKLKSYLADFIK